MSLCDNRGSNEQRAVFRFLCELYPTCEVIYEAVLKNNMRFDCFVKEMGIVIELDGAQHYKYIEHFHGDANGFLSQQIKDSKKDSIAHELGIKILRIKQHECPKTKEELKALIDSVPFPDAEYDYNNVLKQEENVFLERAKEFRRKRYYENKNKKV